MTRFEKHKHNGNALGNRHQFSFLIQNTCNFPAAAEAAGRYAEDSLKVVFVRYLCHMFCTRVGSYRKVSGRKASLLGPLAQGDVGIAKATLGLPYARFVCLAPQVGRN